jgi:hypothetical protein
VTLGGQGNPIWSEYSPLESYFERVVVSPAAPPENTQLLRWVRLHWRVLSAPRLPRSGIVSDEKQSERSPTSGDSFASILIGNSGIRRFDSKGSGQGNEMILLLHIFAQSDGAE